MKKLILLLLISLPAYSVDTFLDLCNRGNLPEPLAESVGFLKLIAIGPQVETNAVPFMKIVQMDSSFLKEKRILKRRNAQKRWEANEVEVVYDGKKAQLRRELYKLDGRYYSGQDLARFKSTLVMEGNNKRNCTESFNRLRDAQGLQLNIEMLLINNGKKWVYTVPSLDPLVGMEDLEYLVVVPPANKNYGTSEIADLRPLSFLKKLMWLDLRSSKIRDISPLLGLSKLEYLDLGDNGIGRAPDMKSMVSLRKLEMGHNQILDTGFLVGMENLRLLNLSFNRLVNIKGVETLKNLNALIISENPQLYDVTPAKDLAALTYLSIKKTSAKWTGGKSPFINVQQ